MELSTKRLPVSLSFRNYECKSNEFLVPFLNNEEIENGFMGIKSGNIFPYGAVSFIGKGISASDILQKIRPQRIGSLDVDRALRDLNRYLEKLQAFRIGNILEIEYLPNGDIRLVKVAEKPPCDSGPRLP